MTTASLSNFTMNGGMSIFHILRVFSMGHELFLILDSTFPSSLSNSSVISVRFSPSFEYVVAEKIFYLQCTIYVLIKGREYIEILMEDMISESHFSSACYLFELYSGIHTQGPWSSPGGNFISFASFLTCILLYPLTMIVTININFLIFACYD